MPDDIDFSILFKREHPFYSLQKSVWEKNHMAYSGGKGYIRRALVPHLSEFSGEFKERLRRAYYFNWPRKIARMITQYVLAVRPEREDADPDLVEDWSRDGMRVDEVMRQFATYLHVFGVSWLAVDSPSFEGTKTRADELNEKLRPYCVAMNPMKIPDWCYGADGDLEWVLVSERCWDNSNPFLPPVEVEVRKLWTRDEVMTIRRDSNGMYSETVTKHNLGCVPFIRQVEVDGFGLDANHWFDDVVNISDAILNNESEAQMNTVKQMFGLLVVSETFVQNSIRDSAAGDADAPKSSIASAISRTAAVVESSNDKGISRYISPSGVENSTIRAENQALIRMLFECIGLAVSKDTKLVESAEAKQWDFQNVEQFMKTSADVLEQCEYKAWELMNKWDSRIPIPTVSYNRNFAVLDLQQAVSSLVELSGFNQDNDEYQREIGKTALVLLNRLRQLSPDKQDAISKQIDKSVPSQALLGAMNLLNAGTSEGGSPGDESGVDNK